MGSERSPRDLFIYRFIYLSFQHFPRKPPTIVDNIQAPEFALNYKRYVHLLNSDDEAYHKLREMVIREPDNEVNKNNHDQNKENTHDEVAREPLIINPDTVNKDKGLHVQYFIFTFKDNMADHKIETFKPTPLLFEHIDNPKSSYNGNMSVHNPNPTAYLTVTGTKIHIMSAFEGYSFINTASGYSNVTDDRSSFYDTSKGKLEKPEKSLVVQKHIVVNTWLEYDLMSENLRCCILLKNNRVASYISSQRIVWYMCKKQPLMSAKVFCSVPHHVSADEQPIGAVVVPPSFGCYSRIFMNIERVRTQDPFSVAICAKIGYGELSPHRVIEWLETQRYLGVDKIVYYFYNLNTETMNVWKAYAKEGFVDLLPFDIPQPGRHYVKLSFL